MFAKILTVLAVNLICCTSFDDVDFILKTNQLPTSSDLLPTLSNGNLGFQVFSDSIYSGYIFNGVNETSCRARIPNYANIQFEYCNPGNSSSQYCTYILNLKTGTFVIQYETDEMYVEQKIYPHQTIVNAIVNEFSIESKQEHITIKLSHDPGHESDDIVFEEKEFIDDKNSTLDGLWQQCGSVKSVDDSRYLTEEDQSSEICMFWSDIPDEIDMGPSTYKKFTYVMVVAHTEKALADIEIFVQNIKQVYAWHANEWNMFWMTHGIEVRANHSISQLVYASMYQVASSMGTWDQTIGNQNPTYGVGNVGLGTNNVLYDYKSDLYIPQLGLVEPQWGYQILSYRFHNIQAARDNAAKHQKHGVKFPYLSGRTGIELSSDEEEILQQLFVTLVVGLAARNQFALTHNVFTMRYMICDLVNEIGKFAEELLEYDDDSKQYEIKNITGINRRFSKISNNLMTNVLASYALSFREFISCICEETLMVENIKQTTGLTEKAKNLRIPYDKESDNHLPFECYEKTLGTLKMSEQMLLGSIIPFELDDTIARNNLLKFVETKDTDPEPMGEILSVVHRLRLNDFEGAQNTLSSVKMEYMQGPFHVWSSSRAENDGLKNYLPAAAAVINAMLVGYGGLRIHLNRLEFRNPTYPIRSTGLYFAGINYLGNVFHYEVKNGSAKILFQKISSDTRVKMSVVGDNGLEQSQDVYEKSEFDVTSKGGIFAAIYHNDIGNLFGDCPIPDELSARISIIDPGNTEPGKSDGQSNIILILVISLVLLIGLILVIKFRRSLFHFFAMHFKIRKSEGENVNLIN